MHLWLLKIVQVLLHLNPIQILFRVPNPFNKLLLSIVLLCSTGVISAQKEQIVLKSGLIRLPKQEFYIDTVIDGRGNKDNIGFVMRGAFNKKVKAEFKGGLEPTLTDFFNYALTKDSSKTPVLMRVVFIQISEKLNGTNETGRAEIKVEFYKRQGDQMAKVFETETSYEETGLDVTSGHERRLRKVLENIMFSFNNSNWQQVPGEYVSFESISSKRSEIIGNTLNPEDVKWVNLLMANAAFGTNAEGWGGAYMGFSTKQKNGWLIPITVALDRITIDPSLFVRAGYNEKVNLLYTYGKVGTGVIRKLGEDFHFLFGLNAIGGPEELTRNNEDGTTTISSGFAFGGEASQSFYFISRGKVGFFLGAGVYERVLTSKIYKTDIGLKIEAGIKF
jgi:hypothetical protein